jgi:serine/threonine protein kinase
MGEAGPAFARRANSVDWDDIPERFVTTDPTPLDGVPALGGRRGVDRPATVPELNPEGQSDSYLSPVPVDETEPDTEVDHRFEPVDESVTEVREDTDAPVDSPEDTRAPTRRARKEAAELEPESTEALVADPPTESGSAGSLYPGKLQYVRAPGWVASGQVGRVEVDARKQPPPQAKPPTPPSRPPSAPLLEPASAPTMRSFRAETDNDDPAMVPVDDKQHTSKIRRPFTAVDQAAKELARAALQAEIEKEDKRALASYEPEEGEIPPSPEVAKRFDVILQLGKGGMAVVYLCRDPRRSGKVLAVKDIRAEMKPGMKVEQRVEHEAKLLKELDHTGIVKVYDFLKFPRGSAIVMEYIDGLPLDHEIGAGRRITWDFGVRILREIGSALHYAHGVGVIHRDIKPDNILYSERHSIMKLVDFGLARMYGDPTELHMTRTGMVVGTPHYMSPEQVSGKVLDQRSDVYSFGATLYYLLTGQRHVEGSNIMDILEQQRSKDIIPPSHIRRDIPGWLSYIIGKMMEIKPDDRYQDMQEALDDVDAAEADPEHFVTANARGPVKRYGGVELTLGQPESDAMIGDIGTEAYAGTPSSEMDDRPTNRVSRRAGQTTRRKKEPDVEVAALPEEVTPQQISALLKEISGRLEAAEKRQVGPGMLVMIVLLSVLLVMLAIVGGVLLAQREGYLAYFGW